MCRRLSSQQLAGSQTSRTTSASSTRLQCGRTRSAASWLWPSRATTTSRRRRCASCLTVTLPSPRPPSSSLTTPRTRTSPSRTWRRATPSPPAAAPPQLRGRCWTASRRRAPSAPTQAFGAQFAPASLTRAATPAPCPRRWRSSPLRGRRRLRSASHAARHAARHAAPPPPSPSSPSPPSPSSTLLTRRRRSLRQRAPTSARSIRLRPRTPSSP